MRGIYIHNFALAEGWMLMAITCNDTRMIAWYVIASYMTALIIFLLIVIAGLTVGYIDALSVMILIANSFVGVLVGIEIARYEVESPPPLAECVV